MIATHTARPGRDYRYDVIVIGGGIAGLEAARRLGQHGFGVTLLEGRSRLGGRVLSHVTADHGAIELGAEFVHGRSPALWTLINSIPLPISQAYVRHSIVSSNQSLRPVGLEDAVEKLLKKIDRQEPDETIESFLGRDSFSWAERRNIRDYVEGFHAAPVDRMGIHSFLAAEESARNIQGDRLVRLKQGYGAVVRGLAEQLDRMEARVVRNAAAKRIHWREGHVSVEASINGMLQMFEAAAVIVTLPLGVWKTRSLQFDPPVPEKDEAVAALGVGQITKIILRFKEPFWPEGFGFIHTFDDHLATWWTNDDPLTLIGWGGDSASRRNAELTSDALVNHAVDLLARTFGSSPARTRDLLSQFYMHNWQRDPYAGMAYTYIPVDQLAAPSQLAKPIKRTLFFAGEATSLDAQTGTIHGAFDSGQRAAREVEETLGKPGS